MKTILITGGTGLVGSALTRALLEKGYRVVILSRREKTPAFDNKLRYARWDPATNYIDPAALQSADAIIHLAGAGVADKRWTKRRKQEIVGSRVQGSSLIAEALQQYPHNVKTVISASAIGWYGPDAEIPNPRPFTEDDPSDNSFLGETCRQWEQTISPVEKGGIRLVKLRIGIVLAKEGGAFREFYKPLRWGIAPVLGNGKQMISWIHIQDLVRQFIFALENETASGIYNAVAPAPVSNKELLLSMAKERKKFFFRVRVPAFFLKLILGEMSIEILKSATVSSVKMEKAGFVFQYREMAAAIKDLLVQKK